MKETPLSNNEKAFVEEAILESMVSSFFAYKIFKLTRNNFSELTREICTNSEIWTSHLD
jgi:sugar phosphate permease